MHQYIRDLVDAISNGTMENTYKMGWIRSIVEFCVSHPTKKEIHFDELAQLIFKYYWDQIIFFQLQQGPSINKRPTIEQIVLTAIDEYQSVFGMKPIHFTRVEHKVEIDVLRISDTLKLDVSYRFPKVRGDVFDFYELDLQEKTISIHHPELLIEYKDILYSIINHRWAQALENFNSSPRIVKKVSGSFGEDIRRGSLSHFRKLLYMENPSKICFITGEPIPVGKESVDHVIPWSYLYSDDIWNLVYVENSMNSRKSNHLPDEKMIHKLEKRNRNLLEIMIREHETSKHKDELELAINRDWVRTFWIGYNTQK